MARLHFDPKQRRLYVITSNGEAQMVTGVTNIDFRYEAGFTMESHATIVVKNLTIGEIDIPDPADIQKAASGTKKILSDMEAKDLGF